MGQLKIGGDLLPTYSSVFFGLQYGTKVVPSEIFRLPDI